MSVLKTIGAAITAVGVLCAVFVLWSMRTRGDRFARSVRYKMLGTISLCAIIPARMFLEQRLPVVPWFALLIALFGGGVFFFWRARRFET